MDIETLRASWEKSVSKNKRCRSVPSMAPRHTVHPEHKPKNQRQRSGRPPWVIAKEQKERIASMDDADRAKEIEQRDRRAAIEMASRHMEPPQQIINGQVLCIDCDEPVQAERLQAKPNAARCIECQGFHEQKVKHHG
ncbi:MAG: TraR/DksA C4-type zinc finger protein [Oceanospirillaceae bacterium]|nr:TraR/DksA C4-type zinc finger protein [Oceanospirillaceae bacterium]